MVKSSELHSMIWSEVTPTAAAAMTARVPWCAQEANGRNRPPPTKAWITTRTSRKAMNKRKPGRRTGSRTTHCNAIMQTMHIRYHHKGTKAHTSACSSRQGVSAGGIIKRPTGETTSGQTPRRTTLNSRRTEITVARARSLMHRTTTTYRSCTSGDGIK